jgi:hypothetical protein
MPVLVGLLALTACGTVPTVVTPTRSPAPVPPTSAPTVAPTVTVSVQPSPTPQLGPIVVLQGESLGFADRVGGPITTVMIGDPASAVLTRLTEALGVEGVERPCPSDDRTEVDLGGFSVVLLRGRFIGWFDRGSRDVLLQTSDGLGIRSRLADLRAARPDVRVVDSGLGTEAVAPGGLTFLLDGRFARSQVTGVFAGTLC